MKTRILSGLIMVPLLVVLYFGGYVLMAAVLLIALVGVKEFYRGFKAIDIHASYPIAVWSTLLLFGLGIFSGSETNFMLWLFLSVVSSLLYLFNIENRKLEDAMVTILGIFYVVFFAYHVVLVDKLIFGNLFVWLIILTAFGTDVFAYFTGVTLGKHKLCPKISPKKSIEGSIGGIIGSLILCGLFGYFFIPKFFIDCIILGVIGGVVSQFGDLTASIFKRKMGIKDYGNLIPGHGGILDRFDSVLFTAPIVYYYMVLFVI